MSEIIVARLYNIKKLDMCVLDPSNIRKNDEELAKLLIEEWKNEQLGMEIDTLFFKYNSNPSFTPFDTDVIVGERASRFITCFKDFYKTGKPSTGVAEKKYLYTLLADIISERDVMAMYIEPVTEQDEGKINVKLKRGIVKVPKIEYSDSIIIYAGSN